MDEPDGKLRRRPCRVTVVEAIYRPLLARALANAVTLQTNL